MNPKTLGYTTMIVSATLMGCVGLFSRNINTSGDVIAFTRMIVGAVCIFAIMIYQGKAQQLKSIKLTPAVITSGVCLGLCLAAYVSATQYTTLANAVFLIYTGPVFSTILAAIFLKEKISALTASMLTAVFIGCLFIIGIISYTPQTGLTLSLSFSKENMVGDILGLISGIGYGLYLFFSRYRTDIGSDSRSLFNFSFGAIAIAICFVINPPSLATMDSTSWLWLISMGFFIGFGALSLLTIAAKHLKAAELACISYLETVVGAGLGILVFSESLTVLQAIGGVLVIGGGMGEIVINIIKKRALSHNPQSHKPLPLS
ncbi:EamA family transporter [Photobacterium carnosum]|uniref:DMT family transporter n=1 Tax=Photobacterium carnosum TaxID=2023717 RepID=UPI001E5C9733|nr:DMT family transporter [Photobacterium carnosum]MCD9538674.1 EamA family transporter [Photobacterium carnosum]MCD9548013.1 EamA family transporter [Photobacterium carnosum]MCF2160478.1 EamA family transporter [Photobacterium carnosum]MCF2305262.1 EamA family transporter [Photobacterium carnosum]